MELSNKKPGREAGFFGVKGEASTPRESRQESVGFVNSTACKVIANKHLKTSI